MALPNEQPDFADAAATEENSAEAEALPFQAEEASAVLPVLDPSAPKLFAFRQPSLFTAAQLRRFQTRQEEFTRSLATRLSMYLRADVLLRAGQSETTGFLRYIERTPNPIHLTCFKVETLSGVAYLEASQAFALSMAERLQGGSGKVVAQDRTPTEIELMIVDHFSIIILKEWCRYVAQLPETAITICGHENNARFLTAAPPGTNLFIVPYEIRIGDDCETLNVAAPFCFLETIARQMSGESVPAVVTPSSTPLKSPAWNPALEDVKVRLFAGWTEVDVPARQLAQLKVGDTLPLPPERIQRVEVNLEHTRKFIGRLGTSGKTRAIELLAATS